MITFLQFCFIAVLTIWMIKVIIQTEKIRSKNRKDEIRIKNQENITKTNLYE